MTSLVTGATGFIGARLCERLASEGDVIRASRGAQGSTSRPGDGPAGSTTPGRTWSSTSPSPTSIASSRRAPPTCSKVNVASTFELAEWARAHDVPRFVFASTGNVYRPSSQLLTESDRCEAGNMYAALKLAAEQILRAYASSFEVVILRLFGVYGPGQQGMLIADMFDRVQRQVEITLPQGTGPVLTPLFVDDCVDILTRVAKRPAEPGVRVFNAAGDETLTLAEMVSEIGRQAGVVLRLRPVDGRAVTLRARNAAVKSVFADFTPFATGVRRILERADAPSS